MQMLQVMVQQALVLGRAEHLLNRSRSLHLLYLSMSHELEQLHTIWDFSSTPGFVA